jgi:sterol desaturase/sphingolipid hydroxylase (fatty acid hydroxylase superfamily)
MELFIILLLGYAAASLTLVLLKRAFKSESMKGWIISEDPRRSVDSANLHRTVRFNSMVSVGFMFLCSFLFYDFLIHGRAVSVPRMVFDVVLVLVLYDFGYYFIHRYPFHEWRLLRRVHSIHHQTRHPRGIDSLLLHPAETCIGLGAFLSAVALVGGVHYYSFAVLFIGYTTLNVINHAGIGFRRFPLRTLGHLAVQHDKHHRSMRSGNYAFLTPIPDALFGTLE